MEISELIALAVLCVPFVLVYRMLGKLQAADRTYEPTGGYHDGSDGGGGPGPIGF